MPALLYPFVFLAAAGVACEDVPPIRIDTPAVTIDGDGDAPEHGLVRLKAGGVSPKAGLVWRVTPAAGVARATNPRGVFEFAAAPGQYTVDLLVVETTADGGITIGEFSRVVTIGKVKPPPGTPPPPGPAKPDAAGALGRIQFGNAGCTATIIHPRRADGKWDILTAAHCVTSVGQRGVFNVKDGRRVGVSVSARQAGVDLAWLVTDDATLSDLPYAVLAPAVPPAGTACWHMGYGIDRPGNREDGTVSGPSSNGQIAMTLNVSSGDSGGGIFRGDTNELIAAVCCTQRIGAKVTMYGGSSVEAAKLRPKAAGAPATTPAAFLFPARPRTPAAALVGTWRLDSPTKWAGWTLHFAADGGYTATAPDGSLLVGGWSYSRGHLVVRERRVVPDGDGGPARLEKWERYEWPALRVSDGRFRAGTLSGFRVPD